MHTKLPPVAVVTLTGFEDIFRQFWAGVLRYEPAARVIVVRSRGVDLSSEYCPHCRQYWPQPDWEFIDGIEPFVFARNANIGIRAAGSADVFLVNDDVSWTRAGALDMLQQVAYRDSKIAVLSPQFIGGVGNRLQSRRIAFDGLRYSTERLCFTGVYLKREALDDIGLLDERFDGYGSEDDDWCYRARRAGWRLAVTSEAIFRHGREGLNASVSFARTMGDTRKSAEEMHQRFLEKHEQEIYRPGTCPTNPVLRAL